MEEGGQEEEAGCEPCEVELSRCHVGWNQIPSVSLIGSVSVNESDICLVHGNGEVAIAEEDGDGEESGMEEEHRGVPRGEGEARHLLRHSGWLGCHHGASFAHAFNIGLSAHRGRSFWSLMRQNSQ